MPVAPPLLPHGRLSEMLAVLRQVFDAHPDGIDIDAELARFLADGLRDMHRAALAMEQAEIERGEMLAMAEGLDLAGRAATSPVCLTRPVSTIVPFPVMPRPRPLAADRQGEGGAA